MTHVCECLIKVYFCKDIRSRKISSRIIFFILVPFCARKYLSYYKVTIQKSWNIHFSIHSNVHMNEKNMVRFLYCHWCDVCMYIGICMECMNTVLEKENQKENSAAKAATMAVCSTAVSSRINSGNHNAFYSTPHNTEQ